MSREILSEGQKTMNGEVAKDNAGEFIRFSLSLAAPDDQEEPPQKKRRLPGSAPPSIFRLKNDHVEPEHQELVRLTLSTGTTYQSPPQKSPPPPPPESPPHPSLLQLMPPSSSSTLSLEPPRESLPPHQPFSQLRSQLCSKPTEPRRFLVSPQSQSLHQNSFFTQQQPPALPVPPPLPKSTANLSLLLPSSSSQYIEPPPGFPFPTPSSSSRQLPKRKRTTVRSPEPHCTPSSSSQPVTLPEQPPTPRPQADQPGEGQVNQSGHRRARNSKKQGWQPTIEPPYPWSTSTRARIQSMEELLFQNITVITGDVICKECKMKFQIEYDLESKFRQVVSFITREVQDMNDRAPDDWAKPVDLDCKLCEKSKCVQPAPLEHKRETNWLFLFLGQMIGYLKFSHLKYFCKHTNNHRTAAKDRLVYLTYKNLHCQLDPKAEELYDLKKEEVLFD